MATGPFGGPRPFLSRDCVLVIRDYSAVPSPTLSGGTSPDRTAEFRESIQRHLPVTSISTEPHDVDPGLFGDYLVAELSSNRIALNQYLDFIEEYAHLIGTEELEVVNVGIDARIAVENRVPRPFVETGVHVAEIVEIRYPRGYSQSDVEEATSELETKLSWVTDSTVSGPTGILQAQGGINDLVVSQVLELRKEMQQSGIEASRANFNCKIIE